MRVTILALAGIVSVMWLASVHAAVPAPTPGVRDTDYRPIADGCGYGRHWLDGYTASGGGWVPGRCQADR
jgi:hypothetical protein